VQIFTLFNSAHPASISKAAFGFVEKRHTAGIFATKSVEDLGGRWLSAVAAWETIGRCGKVE
jgi:hypothetical protein